ncbi:cupin domain-containing protein [Gynuella sp.]|uniref:cupin domain-containing protein n=1 Tax=Gynuella sp. TaxID=2969146 RepID=UPI003D0E142C
MTNLPPVRRIVTGHNEHGKATISSDGTTTTVLQIPAIPGIVFHEVWNTQQTPAIIDNSDDPTGKPVTLQPASGGTTIRVVDIPPDSVQNNISEEALTDAFADLGASHAADTQTDKRHKIMHRTETIDYGILLSGELWLMVDEGEVLLKPGDIVVQRGTNHAWSNRSEETARIAFILIDGEFAEEIR